MSHRVAGAISPRQVQDLEQSLRKLTMLEHKRLGQVLAEHRLTVPQFLVLMSLAERDNHCAIGLLANKTLQSYPTMTGIIDRLEKEGLVARRRGDVPDRRQVLVTLTDRGRAMVERAKQARQESMRRALLDFPAQDLRALLRLLDAYIKANTDVSG